jgi:hypothetical protein
MFGNDETSGDDSNLNDAVRELLQALPNLEVLTVKGPRYTIGDWFFHASQEIVCPKLKVFHWPESLQIPSSWWYHFIKNHPDLTSINVKEYDTVDMSFEGLVPFFHEHITTLHVDVIEQQGRGLKLISFPSLNRLSILAYSYDYMHPSWENDLLSYVSPSLTAIQLNLYGNDVAVLETYCEEEEITKLRPLFTSCPNLKRIDVVLDRWNSDIIRHALTLVHIPSTVAVIGIRICDTSIPDKDDAEYFLGGLKMLLDSMASQVAIQFLDDLTHEYILRSRRALVRESQKSLILTSWLTSDGKPFNL